MRFSKILLAVLVGAVLAAPVIAKTPDGATPAVETICDVFRGNKSGAFGLCNAYCEAMDCGDPNQHASSRACMRVRANFERKYGIQLPVGDYDVEGNPIDGCVIDDGPGEPDG